MSIFITNKVMVFALIMVVMLAWSGNYVAVTYAVNALGSYVSLSYRLILVCLLILPFVKRPCKSDFKWLLLSGILMIPLHTGFLFLALESSSSLGGVSLAVQLGTPLSVIASAIFYKDKPFWWQVVGICISFVGIIMLFYTPSMFDNIPALLLGVVAALFLALYFSVIKQVRSISGFALIGYNCLVGLPFVLVLAYLRGEDFVNLFEFSSRVQISFLYTVVGGSILGHGIWAFLVKYQNMSYIVPFMLLVPVFSTLFGVYFFDQTLGDDFLFVAVLMLVGILFVMLPRKLFLKKDESFDGV